jgi:cytidylate kinase
VKINIAIDGYSSCGKSTLAKDLAHSLGYTYADSGAMYRAVALYAINQNFIFNNHIDTGAIIKSLDQISISFLHDPITLQQQTLLNGENVEAEIRKMEVAQYVSQIAAIPEVRKKLVELQQNFGKTSGLVMDGRDIGTVVFPDAALKIFMTASPEVRARRRLDELRAKGENPTLDDVLENLKHRDYTDTHRAADPLRKAPDARVLDNSDHTRESQLQLALQWANELGIGK